MASKPTPVRIALAFLTIYLVWGSTYLGIRIALETLPPFYMSGVRFLLAGSLLFTWALLHGAALPSGRDWKCAALAGGFLLLGGNGGVVWAEKTVPSGAAALMVATMPMWMVLLLWIYGTGGPLARGNGVRPPLGVMFGLLLGFCGVALLLRPDRHAHVPLAGYAVLILAALSSATGSLYLRRTTHSTSPVMVTAMQMLVGGALLFAVGRLCGESVHLAAFSARSLLALLYLIVFGALLGYTAYIWLLGAVSPSAVSTYAYVNPLVAVFLGWSLGGEAVTSRTLLAAAIILTAVAIITWHSRTTKK